MDTLINIGTPAPPFELPDLEGAVYQLDSIRGKVGILNFWSAECPWSESADRQVLSYLPNWGDAVALWAIASNANEPLEMIIRTAAERALHVLLHDKHQIVADLYGALTTPHFFVIDQRLPAIQDSRI